MTQIAAALAKFGNVREAAEKIGRPPSVIQYWRSTNRIPATALAAVLHAAEKHGIAIEAADLITPVSEQGGSREDEAPAEAA